MGKKDEPRCATEVRTPHIAGKQREKKVGLGTDAGPASVDVEAVPRCKRAQRLPGTKWENTMAPRKSLMTAAPERPGLDRLLAQARTQVVSEAELAEQRTSFIFGNAPEGSTITKESARAASYTVRLLHG